MRAGKASVSLAYDQEDRSRTKETLNNLVVLNPLAVLWNLAIHLTVPSRP